MLRCWACCCRGCGGSGSRWGAGWWRLALVGGLGMRVVLGLLRNWTMRLDAEFMNNQGHEITQQLWANPGQAWQ